MAAKKETIVIAKYTVKRNGAVIYRMRSNIANKIGRIDGCDQVERNEKFYDVYMVASDGEYVFGCQTSGEPCKGNMYRGTCCHRKHAQMLLDAAKDAKIAGEDSKSAQAVVTEIVVPTSVVVVPVELKVERTQVYDKDRCCYVWSDTREALDPQPDGKIWVEGLGWVMPPSDEPVDHYSELGNWYAVKRNAKNVLKAQMCSEISEIKSRKRSSDLGLAGHLNRKAFSIL